MEDSDMTTRRWFLGGLAAAVLAPLGFWRGAPAAGAPGFHRVNGWILTDADVRALRDYA
jgi:hypothetical protein